MLAFIHVAKTGGQSIETMLASSFGAGFSIAPEWGKNLRGDSGDEGFIVPKFTSDDLRRLRRWCPWMKCIGGHPVTLWSDFEEVTPTTWFSMIREPLARGASHFQYNLNDQSVPPKEWDQWVNWPVHQNHQVKMFSPTCNADDAISRIIEKNVFVGLTERFDESLVILRKLVAPGLNISYRRTNTASDNSRARQIMADPSMVEQLRAMYREELPLYEFVSQQWYPKFQKEYGPTLNSDVESFQKNREKEFNQFCYWMSRLNHHIVLNATKKLS